MKGSTAILLIIIGTLLFGACAAIKTPPTDKKMHQWSTWITNTVGVLFNPKMGISMRLKRAKRLYELRLKSSKNK